MLLDNWFLWEHAIVWRNSGCVARVEDRESGEKVVEDTTPCGWCTANRIIWAHRWPPQAESAKHYKRLWVLRKHTTRHGTSRGPKGRFNWWMPRKESEFCDWENFTRQFNSSAFSLLLLNRIEKRKNSNKCEIRCLRGLNYSCRRSRWRCHGYILQTGWERQKLLRQRKHSGLPVRGTPSALPTMLVGALLLSFSVIFACNIKIKYIQKCWKGQ